jgi:hypothetical protein
MPKSWIHRALLLLAVIAFPIAAHAATCDICDCDGCPVGCPVGCPGAGGAHS